MALQTTVMQRIFSFKPEKGADEVRLPDPNPTMTVREVQKFYSLQYPAIITGEIEGPITKFDKKSGKDIAVYSIVSNPGTHG